MNCEVVAQETEGALGREELSERNSAKENIVGRKETENENSKVSN
jgi:hypothetical protein